MKLFIGGLVSAVLLAGCATTGGINSEKNDDLYFLGFTPQKDGGFVHGGTGLVCPPTLLGLKSDDQAEFGDNHNDAGCVYRKGQDLATVYLSKLDYSFEDVFQNSVTSIGHGSFGKNIEYDSGATQACILGGLLTAAASVDVGASSSESYVFDAAVFNNPDYSTLVQMTELDGKFLKLRYTVFGSDEGKGLEACILGASALREVYDLSAAHIDG